MTIFINHLKFGIRQLIVRPGFTAMAVLSLGLGIGATTALFSVFKALVLNPFPYPNSERVVYVRSNWGQPLSVPDYLDIREQNTCFAEIGVYRPTRFNFGIEKPESMYGISCTAGVLQALGVPPLHGRWLNDTDEQPGAEPVAVISHSLWSRSFGSDPEILGTSLKLDGRETMVVGVMPETFEFASPWYEGHDYEAWIPLTFDLESQERGSHWLLGIGRLKEGITPEVADAEIKVIGARLAQKYPDTNLHKPLLVRSIWNEIAQHTASGMKSLIGAVMLLLLIACANVASMLLARGTQRQTEFSVRLAIGASRRVLARLLLTETLLLGLLGSVVGVLFAFWGLVIFRNIIPSRLVIEARRAAIQIDGWVLLFAMGVALLSTLLSGLLPAFTAAQTSVVQSLKESGRLQTGSRLRHRFLRQLVVSQIAIAMLLANGGIVLTASYLNVFKNNRALDTDHVISAEISLRGDSYEDEDARLRFWDRLIERVGSLPGVVHVGVTSKLPLEGGSNSDYLVDDEIFDPTVQRRLVEESKISPDYFAAMGIPLLSGRAPDSTDVHSDMIGVAINRAMADKCWPGQNPIGRRIRVNTPEPEAFGEVVGIVESVRQWGAEHEPLPEVYLPCTFETPAAVYLIVRTFSEAHAMVPILRRELTSMDRDLPLANIRTMSEVLQASSSERCMSSGLINAFMGMALLLAGVGLYGTLSYNLLQRKREIGVRIALGALRGDIFRFVVRQAGLWLIAGLVIGLILTAALSFVLRSLVYDISPLNPLSLLLGLGITGGVSCLACLVPTLRATHIDPIEALRYE